MRARPALCLGLLLQGMLLPALPGCGRPERTASRDRAADPPSQPVARLVVEVDRVVGARPLPPASSRPGGESSLAGILEAAGLDTHIHVDVPVADPTGGRPFSEADLHDLHRELAGRRPADPSEWYVHLLLVTRNQAGDLGMITDQTTRQAVAVFANTAAGPDELVRTAAHEIGHALNLFHNDGDGLLSCCKGDDDAQAGLSIMNQERCLAGGWDFRWSRRETTHLRQHPVDHVRPGVHKFGDCVLLHRPRC